MINDDNCVSLDESPRELLPDDLPDGEKQICSSSRWNVWALAIVVVTIVTSAAAIIFRKAVLKASQPWTTSETTPIFDYCSLEGILMQCKPSKIDMLPILPSCITSTYNELKTTWIHKVFPDFNHSNHDVCEPSNKALLFISILAQNGLFDEVRAKTLFGLSLLYFSLDGEKWPHGHSWLSDKSLDQWLGIKLDTVGDVQEITLSGMYLQGSLPTLGILDSLKVLDLSHNMIEGKLPEQIGCIEVLNLEENMISGLIPTIWSSSTSLRALYLDYNSLTGNIPWNIGDMKNLQEFSVAANDLSADVPESLFEKTSLILLDLAQNNLQVSLPSHIQNLNNLQYLDLSRLSFHLNTLPMEIFKLTSLVTLGLSELSLEGTVPTLIGNIQNLSYVMLDYNRLHGSIPSEFGLLRNVLYVSLNNNHFNGTLPIELGNMTNVEDIDVRLNRLTGLLPTEFGNLHQLQSLLIAGNDFDGEIPSEVCQLQEMGNLKVLGDIPTGLSCSHYTFGGAICPRQQCCPDCDEISI